MPALDRQAAARWSRITSGSHTCTARARVLDSQGRELPVPPLPVTSMQVSCDQSIDRWKGQVVVALDDDGIDWRPTRWDSALLPAGSRLRLEMTVSNETEAQSLVLATMLVWKAGVVRPDGTLSVELRDTIAEALGCELPNAVSADGRTRKQLIGDLWTIAGTPGGPLADPHGYMPDGGGVSGAVFAAGHNLVDAVVDLLRVADPGNLVHSDRDGKVVVDRVEAAGPPETRTPVAAIASGTGGHLLTVESAVSRDGFTNRVTVYAKDTDVPAAPPGAAAPPSIAAGPPSGIVVAPDDWQAVFQQVALRNCLRLLAIAEAQIGIGEDGRGGNKYMYEAGPPYGAGDEWCGLFAAWCLTQAGIKVPAGWTGSWAKLLAYVPDAMAALRAGIRQGSPRNGDLCFYTWQHVSIVVDAATHPSGHVTTISGNYGERVVKHATYDPYQVAGYWTPNYANLG